MSFPPIYQFICHSLSAQPTVATLDGLKTQLLNEEIETMRLARVLGDHLITPAFYLANQSNGLIQHYPEDFQSYLANIYALNRKRNQKIKNQLLAFLQAMQEINVDPVVLKGALTLLDDENWDVGERIIGDIDVLIDKEKIHPAVEKLYACGYQYTELEQTYPWASTPEFDGTDPLLTQQQQGASHQQHISPLSHPESPACLELHHEIISKKIAQDMLDGRAVLSRKRDTFPSLEDRVLHNFMHTQIQDRNSLYGRIELRQVHDLAKLLGAHNEEIDWWEIKNRITQTRFRPAFISYLQTTDELFGVDLPQWVRPTPVAKVFRMKQSLYYNHGWYRKFMDRAVLITLKAHKNLSPTQIQGKYTDVSLGKSYYLRVKELGKRLLMRKWWAARLAEFGIKLN